MLILSLLLVGLAVSVLLARVAQSLNTLVEVLVTTEADLKSLLDAIQAGVGTLATQVQAQAGTIAQLREQIAAGTPVTPAQLDDLVTEAAGIRDTLQALAGAPPMTPAVPVPTPVPNPGETLPVDSPLPTDAPAEPPTAPPDPPAEPPADPPVQA